MRPHGFAAILCLLATLTGGTWLAAGAKAPQPQNIDELREAIEAVLKSEKVPGAGVAVVTRDEITWAGGVGMADVAAGRVVTGDTLFRAGSISKSVIALALVKLAEEGKIDLSARLRDVAPEIQFENRWESTAPVRVEHVLEHTSGFDDAHFNELFKAGGAPEMPLREVLAIHPRSRAALWAPGTRAHYSSPGYTVAAYVIEKVTGQPYDDYIRTAILDSLGMSHTGFRLTRETMAALARGYKDSSLQPVPMRDMYLRPAGGLNTSPRELARLVQMFLRRGRLADVQIVKPESIARMERAQTSIAARAGLSSGYGLGIEHQIDGAAVFYGHTGGFEGYSGNYAYSPATGAGYLFFLNSSRSPKAWRDVRALLSNYVLRGGTLSEKPASTLSPEQLGRFESIYQPLVSRRQFVGFMSVIGGVTKVFVRDGVLYRQAFRAAPEPLTPVSDHTFRLTEEADASVAFFQAEGGSMVMATPWSYLPKVSPWVPRARIGFLLLSIVLMLSSLLFAPIWLLRKTLGKMKDVRHLKVRVVPLLAVLSFLGFIFLLQTTPLVELGARTARTGAVWLLTWAFALLSIGGLVVSLHSFTLQVNRFVRIHSLLVSLACSGVVLYLTYWGIIGLRTWAW